MTTRYRIVLDSPLGERRGTLTLMEDGGRASGTLSMLGFDNPVTGVRQGDKLQLQYHLRTLISNLFCTTELSPADGTFCGTAQAGNIRVKLRGTAVSEEISQI